MLDENFEEMGHRESCGSGGSFEIWNICSLKIRLIRLIRLIRGAFEIV